MMTFPTGNKSNPAFTLVELVVVMTIMVVVIAILAPALKGFFHGRYLDNEARQFLSLTRYGQSRAISEGLPVELWIDPRRNRYGLQALSGYTQTQTNPIVYALGETVQVSFTPPTATMTRSNYWTQALAQAQVGGLAKIRFQPDGFISESSPENIVFQQKETGEQIWIAVNSTHLHYDLENAPATLH
jgi:type II secretion system protein H